MNDALRRWMPILACLSVPYSFGAAGASAIAAETDTARWRRRARAPSVPVAFTGSVWGSLAAFEAHAYPGTKRWYGDSGNSFVLLN